jgi:NAD+ diphosphatase
MYSQMPLDRCTNQRKNKQWLKQQFDQQNSLFCLIDNDQNFFSLAVPFSPLYLTHEQLPKVSITSCIFLGKKNDQSIFALNSNKLSNRDNQNINALGQWQSLRQMSGLIQHQDAAILALAKGLVHWHKTHLYCGRCGALNQLIEAGHARRCTDSQCRNMCFPRTDPAVIMLVEKMFDDGVARCLLGRQASWPTGMFSTLAGFVDPGETIEEPVVREVWEESNIEVKDPQYIRSQPWPFPSSVMLGFTATAVTENIDISQDDLHQARWFSREELDTFVAKEAELPEPFGGYRISSNDSISTYLITAWKKKAIGQC